MPHVQMLKGPKTLSIGGYQFARKAPAIVVSDAGMEMLRKAYPDDFEERFKVTAEKAKVTEKNDGKPAKKEAEIPGFPVNGFSSKAAVLEFAATHLPELTLDGNKALKSLNKAAHAAWMAKYYPEGTDEKSEDDFLSDGVEV